MKNEYQIQALLNTYIYSVFFFDAFVILLNTCFTDFKIVSVKVAIAWLQY